MLLFLILRLAVQQHQESIATDIIDDKLLDDVFFIVKQCVTRAAGCGNLDGLCAVSNNGQAHDMFSRIFQILIYHFFPTNDYLCNTCFDFLKCSKLIKKIFFDNYKFVFFFN